MQDTTRVKKSSPQSRRVVINTEWCKGCGICVAFCTKQVLELDQNGKATWAHPDNCIFCGMCELRCPDVAIELMAESAT